MYVFSSKITPMFTLEFEVRDYECDMQGIVNNSVYLNYLEHTRHKFLQSRNLDFSQITKDGIHLVVANMNIQYKKSLKSGDIFTVYIDIQQLTPVKIIFHQYIIQDNITYLTSTITVVATNSCGKIIKIPEKIMKNFV
jgi:acyl-CoA thioester hydrolase